MNIEENISLKKYNTFGIDIKAKYFASISDEKDLLEILKDKGLKKLPKLILGGGSNVLFTKNYEGIVIHLATKGIEICKETDDAIYYKVAAGENWDEFVRFTVENKLGNIENLAAIPGNCGSSPIQNIGAYGVEVKDAVESVEGYEISLLKKIIYSKEECNFGYRTSIFKHQLKNKFIITSVTFKLSKLPVIQTNYNDVRKELENRGIHSADVQDMYEVITSIRNRKLPDYKELGNSGSFFKNPEISDSLFQELKSKYPDIPFYIQNAQTIKIPAAWLIEKSGWKGYRKGDAGVYQHQPLVLVNYGKATGNEILNLSMEIIKSVEKKFQICLEPEVNVV